MCLEIPRTMLLQVKKTIDTYKLLKDSEQIIVAFSGGKDSTFTVMALAQLGYDIIPVTVDMGYKRGWGDKITNYAREIGINPIIVKACDNDIVSFHLRFIKSLECKGK